MHTCFRMHRPLFICEKRGYSYKSIIFFGSGGGVPQWLPCPDERCRPVRSGYPRRWRILHRSGLWLWSASYSSVVQVILVPSDAAVMVPCRSVLNTWMLRAFSFLRFPYLVDRNYCITKNYFSQMKRKTFGKFMI